MQPRRGLEGSLGGLQRRDISESGAGVYSGLGGGVANTVNEEEEKRILDHKQRLVHHALATGDE